MCFSCDSHGHGVAWKLEEDRLQHVTGLPMQTVRVRTTVQEAWRQVR